MRLQVRSGSESGREINVDRELTLGRSAANDVMLSDSDISNHHARLRPVDGGIEVTDTGSRNGTFVNGQRIAAEAGPVVVRPGDELRFANTSLGVVGETDPAAAPAATSVGGAAIAAHSVVVRAGRDAGRSLILEPGRQYTIGRDPASDLVLSDPRVSGQHARIRLDGDALHVEDLRSANGTLLNGNALSGSGRGADNAEVQVGETVLVYYAQARAGSFAPTPTIIGTVGAAATASVVAESQRQAKKRSRLPMVIVGGVAVLALGAAAIAIAMTAGGGGDDEEDDEPADVMTVPEIIDELRPSVIHIFTAIDPDRGSYGSGSGSVIDAREGLILTNNHVATGGENTIDDVYSDKAIEAVLVAAAPCEDLALIKVTDAERKKDFKAVKFGRARDLQQGQQVVALGFPASAESGTGQRNNSLSATQGIISKEDTVYDSPGDVPFLAKAIQHQAAVNPGNSGGPLFDLTGRQIGVNTAIFFIPGRGRAEGENYAINISRVQELLADMKKGISPKWIGVAFDIAVNRDGDRVGLIVGGITPGSPADRAGLVQGDDIIIEVEGEEVFDLHSYCAAMPEGEDETVELTVANRATNRTRSVTLDGVGHYEGPE